MKININEIELVQAIKEYVGNQGIDVSSKTLEVALKATRNPISYSASVMILNDNQDPAGKIESENIMTENFALESTGDTVAKEAAKEVEKIADSAAVKENPAPEPKEETPQEELAKEPENVGTGDDVDNLFA